jgi:FkbM family methyltransferase
MDYKVPESCQIKGLNEIYLKYFGYISDGFFIDVGACDGILASNSWGLSVAGWGGICFEPVPIYYQKCVSVHSTHPKVIIKNTCVGNRNGTVDFYAAGTLSTYNEDYLHSEYWKNDYAYAQKIIVPIVILDDSLFEHNVKPNFEVFSLDVEGSETDVLINFDIDYWKPKMALVEAQEFHPAKELTLQAPFINKYFANAGYEKIYCDEINSVYVRKDLHI